MNLNSVKQKITQNSKVKLRIHKLMFYNARPRWWVKHILNPIVFRHGKKAKIRHHNVMNVSPVNRFYLGTKSTIEEYCVVDNGVGDVIIGEYTRIGLRNTIIGPVQIGNNVILAQNVVLSGLNHNYEDVSQPIHLQGVNVDPIIVEEGAWIGANSVITAGVKIGRHSIIGGGSVVTRNVPPFSVVAGNPARIIKVYDVNQRIWIKQN